MIDKHVLNYLAQYNNKMWNKHGMLWTTNNRSWLTYFYNFKDIVDNNDKYICPCTYTYSRKKYELFNYNLDKINFEPNMKLMGYLNKPYGINISGIKYQESLVELNCSISGIDIAMNKRDFYQACTPSLWKLKRNVLWLPDMQYIVVSYLNNDICGFVKCWYN